MRVNVDLYDTQRGAARQGAGGQRRLRRRLPVELPDPDPARRRGCCGRSTTRALPHLANIDPALPRPALRPRQPLLGALRLGHRRHRLPPEPQAGDVDSWAALWDPRFKGRDPHARRRARDARGRAQVEGRQPNTTDPAALRGGAAAADRRRSRWCATYNSSNFEDVLLSGDVWLAQGWNGQFAKVIETRTPTSGT